MRASVVSLFALVSVSSLLACSAGAGDLPPVSGADGGPSYPSPSADPSAPPSQGEPPALPAAPPKADELTEAFGTFVAKHGTAEATGTRKAPFATIGEAVAKAKAEKKARVYVCEGTYEEALTIENGISIVGGLDCTTDTWKLTDKRSIVASPSSPAVRADGIDKPTRVDNLDVRAPDATDPSGSSLGVLAVDSNALTFSKGAITAGAGSKGADGVEGVQLTAVSSPAGVGSAPSPTSGASGTHSSGGFGATIVCNDPENLGVTRTAGGTGGSSGVFYRSEFAGGWTTSSAPSSPVGGGIGGGNGANGTSGGVGAIGADGYVAADGTDGTSGEAGAGGAGGGGLNPGSAGSNGFWLGRSGPGGGAGGCPGLAGTAGKGGGASLGVVAVRSPLRFEDMTVKSANGGAGGAGTFGSQPTPGTAGGNDNTGFAIVAGKSFPGGVGGAAGFSGSGAGGHSIAIAYQGLAPIVTRSKTEVAAPGAGVPARSGNGKTIPAAPAGVAEPVKAL